MTDVEKLLLADATFSILDQSPVGQFVIDCDFQVLFWNTKMEIWTGVLRKEMKQSSLLDHFPHIAQPEFRSIIDRVLTNGQPVTLSPNVYDNLIPLPLPNGKLRVQDTVVSRITANDPTNTALLLFSIQDVTELSSALEENREILVLMTEEIKFRRQTEEKLRENEKRLAQLANHDALTKLPNRRLLSDRLQQAIAKACRSDTEIAVLFLDLDRFKNINDTLGHDVGDLLLLEVAKRLKDCVRATDTVARQGGDEFVILLEDIQGANTVIYLAEKILKTLSVAIVLRGYELVVTTSIGVSIFPNDGSSVEALLKSADTAMYSAKEQGGNTIRFFISDMNDRAIEMLMLESQLRKAADLGQLMLYYQPKFTLSTNQLIGAEALIRWNHPELGLIAPNDFIPLAEDTGLIVPIGEWVMRTACNQIKTWFQQGFKPVKIAINLSARQFRHQNLIETVSNVLNDVGIGPKFLEMELTESVIMKDAPSTITTLTSLSAMGISLSIDDFGTGYSSLSYLKRFPINSLKIDQSFVQDIIKNSNDAAIVFSTIALAHSMVLPVVAEGIENDRQLRILQRYGCDQGQGFLLGRPQPPEQFIQFLTKRT